MSSFFTQGAIADAEIRGFSQLCPTVDNNQAVLMISHVARRGFRPVPPIRR